MINASGSNALLDAVARREQQSGIKGLLNEALSNEVGHERGASSSGQAPGNFYNTQGRDRCIGEITTEPVYVFTIASARERIGNFRDPAIKMPSRPALPAVLGGEYLMYLSFVPVP